MSTSPHANLLPHPASTECELEELRAAWARASLTELLRGAVGVDCQVLLAGSTHQLRVQEVAEDWMRASLISGPSVLVARHAIRAVFLGELRPILVEPLRRPPRLRFVLSDLVRRRALVTLRCGEQRLRGRLDRLGADALLLSVAPERQALVSLAAIDLIELPESERSRR